MADWQNNPEFLKAVNLVLAQEGGYCFDPADPGGETNFGICKQTYPEIDIKSLTIDDAREIYFRDWWDRYGYGMIGSAKLAGKVFSMAVNMGPRRTHSRLQTAITIVSPQDIEVDGQLGPATFDAIANCDQDKLLYKFQLLCIDYYAELAGKRREMGKFLIGWIRRALA